MLGEISYPQFLEWRAYDELDPFGEERMDVRIADIVRTLHNIYRKRHEPYSLNEFILTFGDYKRQARPQQTWQQMKATGQYIFAMIGDGKAKAT